MRQNCSECQRLWREYAAATTTHVGLESKLRSLEQDSAAAQALADDVSTAANVRETSRRAIHQHEADLHRENSETARSEN